MDAKQLVRARKPLYWLCLPGRGYLVCAKNPEIHQGVPGAGRGADKTHGGRNGPRAAVRKYRRGAFVRNRKPLLAYAVGSACQPARAVREPLIERRARHSGVVEHSDEERQRGTVA